MKTKLVMASSAIVLGAVGLACTFAPEEIAARLSLAGAAPLLVQIIGAAYFAFAMVNWMAKDSLIGGIYNRPVAIGNLTHFVIGALALVKGSFSAHAVTPLCITAVVYVVFAIAFAVVFFVSPVRTAAA